MDKTIIKNGDCINNNEGCMNIDLDEDSFKSIVEICVNHIKSGTKDIIINHISLPNNQKSPEKNILSYGQILPYLKKLVLLGLKSGINIKFRNVPICIFKKIDDRNYRKLIRIFLCGAGKLNNGILKNKLSVECKDCIFLGECGGIENNDARTEEKGGITGIHDAKLIMLRGGLGGNINFRSSLIGLLESGEIDLGRIDIIVNDTLYFYFEDIFEKIRLRNADTYIHSIKNWLVYEGRYLNGDTSIKDTLMKDCSLMDNGYKIIYLNLINTSDILFSKLIDLLNANLLVESGGLKTLSSYKPKSSLGIEYGLSQKAVSELNIKYDFLLNQKKIIILDMFTSESNGYIKNIGFENWKSIFSLIDKHFGGNINLIFTGKTEDKMIFEYWDKIGSDKKINLINKTDLSEYFHLIENSDIFITNESLGSNFAFHHKKNVILFTLPNIYEALKNNDDISYNFQHSKLDIPHGISNLKKETKDGFIKIQAKNILCISAMKNSFDYLNLKNAENDIINYIKKNI